MGERPKQGLVTQTVSKIVMSFAKQVSAARVLCGKVEVVAQEEPRGCRCERRRSAKCGLHGMYIWVFFVCWENGCFVCWGTGRAAVVR